METVNYLRKLSLVFISASVCAAASAPNDFEQLFDHYFPKHGEYLNSEYRKWFDETLSAPKPEADWRNSTRQFYYAFRGDAAALHRFLHDSDAGEQGEFGETWVYECVVLLLKCGDDRFSHLVAKEDRKTRQAVGYAVDPQIDWDMHQFPKARALYSYRYQRPTQRELDERARVPIAEGPGLNADRIGKLNLAFQKDSRFSGVQLYSTQEFGGITKITAPKLMPTKDKAELQRLIRRELRDQRGMKYEKLLSDPQ